MGLWTCSTDSTERSPSWEANRFSASQEIPPAFYRTRRFITAFTSARHLSLSWASSIQYMPPYTTSSTSNWIPSTPGSSHWSLSLRFPHQNPVYASPLLHTCYMLRPTHSSRFNHPKSIGWGVSVIKLLRLHCIVIWKTLNKNLRLYVNLRHHVQWI